MYVGTRFVHLVALLNYFISQMLSLCLTTKLPSIDLNVFAKRKLNIKVNFSKLTINRERKLFKTNYVVTRSFTKP